MPTVLRIGGLDFYFYSNERNEPPHIHVRGGGGDGKWWIESIRLEYAYGFSVRQIRQIEQILEAHKDELLEAWNGYFGE